MQALTVSRAGAASVIAMHAACVVCCTVDHGMHACVIYYRVDVVCLIDSTSRISYYLVCCGMLYYSVAVMQHMGAYRQLHACVFVKDVTMCYIIIWYRVCQRHTYITYLLNICLTLIVVCMCIMWRLV